MPLHFLLATCILLGTTSCSATAARTSFTRNLTANYLIHDVPEILVYIFTDTYLPLSNTIVIVPGCIGPTSKDVQNDILDVLLSENNERMVFEIQSKLLDYESAQVAFLWFIDSIQSFREILSKLFKDNEKFKNSGYYTILLIGSVLETKQQLDMATAVFNGFWEKSITNVLFLVSDKQRTTFYTFYAYSVGFCGSPQPFAHNYFWHSAASGNSTDKEPATTGFQFDRPLFPKKCRNFYNCPIKVATFEFPPFIMLSQLFKDNHNKRTNHSNTFFDGIEGTIVRVLSQRLNFMPILVSPEDNERWGACDKAETNCNGSLKLMLHGKANMSIGMFGTNTFRGIEKLSSTIPYYSSKVVFAVPRGRPVSNVEKLLMPFQFFVWTGVIVYFGIGIALVLALRYVGVEARRFVVGRSNKYPLLTMVCVWLGNAAHPVPGRNFARFLLMMWICFAFVLRTGYQGALFDILRFQRSLAPVNSLNQIVSSQFDIYVSTRLGKYVRGMDGIEQSLIRLLPTTKVDEYLMKTAVERDFNGVVVVVEPTIAYFNQYKMPKGQQLIYSPVVVHTIQNVIYVDKRSCLLEPFDQELWMYLSSGLITSWKSKFLKKTSKHQLTGKDFQIMRLPDVLGIFQVYAMLAVIAIMVFLGELWWHKRCIKMYDKKVNGMK